MGGFETGRFRAGKAENRRSLYGVGWAVCRHAGLGRQYTKAAVRSADAEGRKDPVADVQSGLALSRKQPFVHMHPETARGRKRLVRIRAADRDICLLSGELRRRTASHSEYTAPCSRNGGRSLNRFLVRSVRRGHE